MNSTASLRNHLAQAAFVATAGLAQAQDAAPDASAAAAPANPEASVCAAPVKIVVPSAILNPDPSCAIKGSPSNQFIPGTRFVGVLNPSAAANNCFKLQPTRGRMTASDGKVAAFNITGQSGVLASPTPPEIPTGVSMDGQYVMGNLTARSYLQLRFPNADSAVGHLNTVDRITAELSPTSGSPSRLPVSSELLTALPGSSIKAGSVMPLFKSATLHYKGQTLINPGFPIPGARIEGEGCLHPAANRLIFNR